MYDVIFSPQALVDIGKLNALPPCNPQALSGNNLPFRTNNLPLFRDNGRLSPHRGPGAKIATILGRKKFPSEGTNFSLNGARWWFESCFRFTGSKRAV